MDENYYSHFICRNSRIKLKCDLEKTDFITANNLSRNILSIEWEEDLRLNSKSHKLPAKNKR